jgi:hypothetical protein
MSSFACPACYALYGVTGESWYRTLGAALIPLCLCLVLVFWLGAPRDDNASRKREKVNTAVAYLWCSIVSVGVFYGQTVTDPDGTVFLGALYLSFLVWVWSPLIWISTQVRRIIAQLDDVVLAAYMRQSVFISGIASVVPILYMSLETVKCMTDVSEAADSAKVAWQAAYTAAADSGSALPEPLPLVSFDDECGGVLWPQNSICFFLTAQFLRKVVIAPLSPSTTTIDDVMSLHLSKKVQVGMFLISLSGIFNLYQFAYLSPGPVTGGIVATFFIANVSLSIALFIELLTLIAVYRSDKEKLNTNVRKHIHLKKVGKRESSSGGSERESDNTNEFGGRMSHEMKSNELAFGDAL